MTSDQKDQIPKEVQEKLNRAWLIRPCHMYKMEHRECMSRYSSYTGKTNMIYIYGKNYKPEDCNQYMEDFYNCSKWNDTSSYQALEKLLKREEERLAKRHETIENNDIWKYRTSPPEDWDDELPERLQVDPNQVKKQACVIL